MTKSEVARSYRDSYGMDMPSHKLARIMYAENNLLFKDVENARSFLRYIEGKFGKKQQSKINKTEYYMKEKRPINPYKFPDSDEANFTPYKIKGHKRILILSDIHVPYHSIEALTAAFNFAKKEKPDAILLNGDTIDCHRLSRFVKDPKKRNFALELDTFKELFAIIKKTFNCKIYFKVGNHEERYEHFLMEKASELAGIEEFEFANILKARAEGIEIIDNKRPMQIGHLWGIHGHEYVGGISAPVNPARGLFLRSKVSCFQGHNHQTSEHTEPTLAGKMVTTFSIGCLSELHPQYMPLNKWNHGFAIVDMAGDEFEFRNKRIFKGKVL